VDKTKGEAKHDSPPMAKPWVFSHGGGKKMNKKLKERE